MRGVDIEKLKQKKSRIITTEQALKDVIPYLDTEEIKKRILSNTPTKDV